MRIADVLPQLTILPLRRFADAWSVITIKSDKRDVFEQAILGEIHNIDSDVAVRNRLSTFEREVDYVRNESAEILLRLVIDEPGYVINEGDLIKRAVAAEEEFFQYARDPMAIRHLDGRTVEIYGSVLEVAWENKVSFDELQLIKRLQRKLNICRRDHRVLEIRAVDRIPMTAQDAEAALRVLNNNGLLVQFKHRGNTEVVCPEEIGNRLRSIYGVVLQSAAYRNLASKLPMKPMKSTLDKASQPSVSIRKDFLIERLIDGDVPPARLLDELDDNDLNALFDNFPEQKPPNMRAAKIRHLINHFDHYAAGQGGTTSPPDPDQTYFTYLVELASRKYDSLYAANVIQRDQNVDRAFERGVRLAFSKYLGHAPIEFTGSAHADGGIAPRNQRMVLWDCKSALEPYALTEARCAQFIQYIQKEKPNIVSPFIVFSGAFTEDGQARALTLKATCSPGTEVCLMAAGDLKWLAEKWNSDYPTRRLPLDVLGHTGVMTREVLEFRLKTFVAQAAEREVPTSPVDLPNATRARQNPQDDISLQTLISENVVQPPLDIEKDYLGHRVTARIERDGQVTCLGQSYDSLSTAGGVARASVSGSPTDRKIPQTNGWTFWRFRDADGRLKPLDELRQQYRLRTTSAG
jgi:Restriction Enzyme Adenine Methylase Associated